MSIWLTGLGLSLVTVVLFAAALVRRADANEAEGVAQADVQFYREQLADLERDVERGTITTEEAGRARTEISRRLLEADAATQKETPFRATPKPARWAGIALIAAVVFGGGAGLYWHLGAPGYDDMPLAARIAAADENRANRPDQATAETNLPDITTNAPPELVELVEKLREVLVSRPDDLVGHELLVANEARLGNMKRAYEAQSRVIELKEDQVNADDFATYADLLIRAAGGYVSPEAEAALTRALQLDPKNGTARYYSGLMFLQGGRPDIGFRLWAALLEDSTAADPWVEAIAPRMQEVAARAGVRYEMPDLAPAPGNGAAEAMQNMTEEERGAMIRGMVEGLAERLANEGGTAQEWARLINALGVLGETDRAKAIWQEAQSNFAGQDTDLEVIRRAAESAGVTE